MIVGKYLMEECDYINLVKVCKKYKELLLMYKFNPISNCDLFPNIQTQHFYSYADIFYRKRNMFRYIYWIEPFLLYDYFKLIDTKVCTLKNVHMYKFIDFAKSMNITIRDIHFNNLVENMKKIKNGYLIFFYNKTFFGIILENEITTYPKTFKSKYFIGNTICGNCDVFISILNNGNTLYVRDPGFNDIFLIDIAKMNIGNLINQDYPEIKLERELNNLPNLMKITEYCIIEI